MRAAARAGAMTLLDGYKAANPGSLTQTHRALPMSLHPPAAYVESINEGTIDYSASHVFRTPEVVIRFVRGTFSRGDVTDANDELVDGFIDYVRDNFHAAGANTLSLVTSVEDDDGWTPEWMAADSQPIAYYTTLVTLGSEGQFGAL